MAQRGVVVPQGDRNGSTTGVRMTVGLDGIAYEIDLSAAEARELRAALRPWISCARVVGGSTTAGRIHRGAPTRVDRMQVVKMRQWALQNGHRISSRGRVPRAVQQAFAQAHA